MSYDLYFWREEQIGPVDPDARVALLSNEQPVQGIARLPNASVVAAFQKEFPEIRFEMQQLVWEGNGTGFEITFSHPDDNHVHMIVATCGYGLLDHPDILNRIIDVAHFFGCGVYDPQVPQRFPEPDYLPAR